MVGTMLKMPKDDARLRGVPAIISSHIGKKRTFVSNLGVGGMGENLHSSCPRGFEYEDDV